MEIVALQDEEFFEEILGDIPRLELLSATRPWARAHLIERETRRLDDVLRAVYTLHIWAEQLAHGLRRTPPCLACGLPTGNFCDLCSVDYPGETAKAVCTTCEEVDHGCQDCITEYGQETVTQFSAEFYADRAARGLNGPPTGYFAV